MSFKGQKPFRVNYKSLKHLERALRRNAKWNQTFSPRGQAAAEMLKLVGISASLMVTTTTAGAKIGSMIGGPKGTAIGAGIGFVGGATASYFVMRWYLRVLPPEPDGTVTAVFSPA